MMRWTYDEVAQFYTRARRRARCCRCGSEGLVEVPGGHPVRQGGGLQAVKERIRRVGWQCRKCSRGTAAADGSRANPRRRVDELRKELKGFKDRHPEEMKARREERIKRLGVEGNAEFEREAVAAGTWMDPDELARKRAELEALVK